MAKIADYEGGDSVSSSLRVDCGSTSPRAEINTTIPGSRGEPKKLKLRFLTSGQELYSKTLNAPRPDARKFWSRENISTLDSEWSDISPSIPPKLYLYIANCDQPGVLALFTKDIKKLNRPGTYTCSVDTARAARVAKGYAKGFYKYVQSIGGKRMKLTVWLGNRYLPTKYQIETDGHDVEIARWVVSFTRWHMAPIKLPPKSETR